MRFLLTSLLLFSFSISFCQDIRSKWVDSVYNSLTPDQRIAQLMIVRLSSIELKTNKVTFFTNEVEELVKNYNIGGVLIFQGGPVQQAMAINRIQQMAKTPVMISIDAEWGVGQRILDSVLPLPRQMMLGAMRDSMLMYRYGQVVADQCKRLGIHVNYAPVVDVNNNPANPVINDRSFGEDKFKVASHAIQYMKGMQDNGVMACAKHFPGHGDVSVDSHLDLPVINKSLSQLDSLELYPFKRIFSEGVGSVMIAHLYIPSIDPRANRATSISEKNIKDLLRSKLNYDGLTFTDALEMQGVQKFFPKGEASVESLIAGNDMLCLPGDVPVAIKSIQTAILKNRLTWKDIEIHCKKVLAAKFDYVIEHAGVVDTAGIAADLNKFVPEVRRSVAEKSITLVAKNTQSFFPLNSNSRVAYVAFGITEDNAMAERLKNEHNADVFYFSIDKNNPAYVSSSIEKIVKNFDKIIIGIHNINRPPVNNFGISKEVTNLISQIEEKKETIIFLFGNAYAAKNWCHAKNLVICYEDDPITQHTAIDMLQGLLPYMGVLPVTVCSEYQYGFGISAGSQTGKKKIKEDHFYQVDSIVTDAIKKKATPGAVVLIAKDGNPVFHKAYGYYTYDSLHPVSLSTVYDIASLTKTLGTTLAIMKLYDEGKIDLKRNLSYYLPELQNTNKKNITIQDLLLHRAGLRGSIPFFRETIDKNGPLSGLYSSEYSSSHSVEVAPDLFLRNDYRDLFLSRIHNSPVSAKKYIYSDLSFIYLGLLIEAVSGMPTDQYLSKTFYQPMGLKSTGFKPLSRITPTRIAPTEHDKNFRKQILRGTVHDPTAAILGGTAGNAGIFSTAEDCFALMQMLLNKGYWQGKQLLSEAAIREFTRYHNDSRRGLGFDKPDQENSKKEEPYPTKSASPGTFGHTGYTGTSAWADPANNVIFIMLSNRVYPNGSDLFLKMNIRPKIHEVAYQVLNNTN